MTKDVYKLAKAISFARPVKILAAISLIFVLEMTLMPFDFSISQIKSGNPIRLVSNDATALNVLSNIVLFIPLGLFTFLHLERTRKNRIWVACLTTLYCTGISLTVELCQAFSSTRISSIIDLITNSAGGVIGILIAFTFENQIKHSKKFIIYLLRYKPRSALQYSFIMMLTLAAAFPFTFAIDVGRFKEIIKNSSFSIFGEIALYQKYASDALLQGNADVFYTWLYKIQKAPADWVLQIICFAVFTWIVYPTLIQHYKFSRKHACILCLWIGMLLSIGFTFLSGINVGTGFHITEMYTRIAGVIIGSILCMRYYHADNSDGFRVSQKELKGISATIFISLLSITIYTGILPIQFDQSLSKSLQTSTMRTEFIPFAAYFNSRIDTLMVDTIKNIIVYGLLTICWLTWKQNNNDFIKLKKNQTTAICLVIAGIASVIELIQLALPVRTTDITDIILPAVGAYAGIFIYAEIKSLYKKVQENMNYSGEESTNSEMIQSVMGSLSDPHPDAPEEKVPGPANEIQKTSEQSNSEK